MSRTGSSVYTFVEDLRGEGAGAVLDRIAGYGARAVTVAAAYHQARDVTPHGAARVTWRGDGVHLMPDDDLFDGLRLQPPVQDGAEAEPLKTLLADASERGLDVHGWAVLLHSTTLGLAHPDVTTEDCFGSHPSPADLCPANPDVRAYAVALGRAVARRGVSAVVAESLHFGAFGHGYAHERVVVPLGPIEFFCWGLCFCAHCAARAQAAGVDAADARATARTAVESVLTGGTCRSAQLGPDSLRDVSPALAAYAAGRCDSVMSLTAEVAAAVAAEGARLVVIDLSGAAKGYADGRPSGPLAAHDAWQFGVDPAAVARVAPGYAVLAYASDAQRIAADVAAYREAVGPDTELRIVLRPGLPDNVSQESLSANVAAARAGGADAVDFYCYGLQPLPVLDRITAAIAPS